MMGAMRSARWFRLSIGLLFVVVPLWVLFTRLDAIWNGHPAYPTTLLVTVGVGLCLIAFALWPWRPDPEPAGPPWEQHDGAGEKAGDPTLSPGAKAARGSTGWRIAGRIVVAILAVLFVGVLAWLRPFTAGADALAALHSDAVVTVVDNPTTIEMSPAASATPSVGLVFSPGARVDARAYAALLRPSAEAGYLVVILKEPFGLALTQAGQSAGPITDHPEVSRWAVGGHSLGGVSAASFAGDHLDTVDGLLLWASYRTRTCRRRRPAGRIHLRQQRPARHARRTSTSVGACSRRTRPSRRSRVGCTPSSPTTANSQGTGNRP